MKIARWTITLVLVLSGCRQSIWCCVDRHVSTASSPADWTPTPAALPTVAPAPTVAPDAESHRLPAPVPEDASQSSQGVPSRWASHPRTAAHQERPFDIPAELPGANAPPLRLPPLDPTKSLEQRKSLLDALFPELPQLDAQATAADLAALPSPTATPVGLAELQQLALENSPVLRKAAANVEAARGLAIQAGLGPNPTVGYEGDTLGTAGTAGYNGLFFSQEIVTAGKLSFAQNAALMGMRAAQQALRRARIQLASDVRRGYFGVLVAQEQARFSVMMAQLIGEVYQAQIALVAGGEAAAYEPLQIRVLAVQARNQVIQARNQVIAQWRVLAATLGVPGLPPSPVAGAVEAEAPALDYQTALDIMLRQHSDLAIARAEIAKASFNLRLQQVTPIPNIELYSALQHDATSPRDDLTMNLQIGLPLPVFDQNQGNITAAYAQIANANQQLIDVRNGLQGDLADAFGRYASSRAIVNNYRQQILADQVRAYRGVYDRFRQGGGAIDFAQVIVTQQTLSQVVTGYLQSLSDQWDAMVDVAELMQIDDLFGPPFITSPAPENLPN